MNGFSPLFSRLQSRADLIAALNLDEAVFDRILAFVPPPPKSKSETTAAPVQSEEVGEPAPFWRHDIPKKNVARGFRTVWEPTVSKSAYKALARRLEAYLALLLPEHPHPCVYGYRPGRNIRENAAAHCGKKYILKLDIKAFFPSITMEMVLDFLGVIGFAPEVAGLLARFVTIEGSLPLGLPTSPVLSNGIMLPLDHAFNLIAERMDARYTRYADDLTFSSDEYLPRVEIIRDLLRGQGFELADDKTRISKLGQAHFVTGLSVADPSSPHVPAAKKRRLRQELYFAQKFGLANHFARQGITDKNLLQREVNKLDGMVKFVAHHEPKHSDALKNQWSTIIASSGMKPSFTPRGQHRAPFFLFIDEAEIAIGKERFLALAIAVTQHPQRIIDDTTAIWQRHLADLWADGNANDLEKRGLHFTDATEDLRREYIMRLTSMPFEGYVALAPLTSGVDYQQTYLRLLGAMISRRLMAAESQFAYLDIEQNDKVNQQEIKKCVQKAFDDLKESNNRRPLQFHIEFVAKPHAGVSVPDFLLGVLGKYLQLPLSQPAKPERYRLMFERLRDKFRLILTLEPWTEYSRRRPIQPWTD